MDVLVARQAIFDRQRSVFGYELLFRSDPALNRFDGSESASATLQVISNTLMTFGAADLTGGKKAFINFDHRLLRENVHLNLPSESVVLEILETVEPTQDLVNLCRAIGEQGYALALDDFAGEARYEPVTDLVRFIKVDLRTTSREDQLAMLARYQKRGIRMLAEKVETQEEFEWARRVGYDLFQGYFFAHPVIVRGQQIPANQTACLRLMRETQKPDMDFTGLERLIREDLSLTYKLLRYVNSPIFAHRDTIQSITRALVLLGESGIRRWASLATLPMLASKKPSELITMSLIRARFCERLAQIAHLGDSGEAFLMGMFSLLDALIDKPMGEILEDMDLGPGVNEVLMGNAGEKSFLAKIYRLIRAYEQGDWENVERVAAAIHIPPSTVGDAYLDSAFWAEHAVRPA